MRNQTNIAPLVKLLRFIPPGTPGKIRVARMLLKKQLEVYGGIVSDWMGFQYEVPDLHEPIAFHVAVDGIYEPETLHLILQRLRPADIFVDVGANIGLFTVPAAQRVGSKGRVLAAEASPDVFPYLQRNVKTNGVSHVTCVQTAVCASDGTVSFYTAPKQHFGMGSMGAQFNGNPIVVSANKLDQMLDDAKIGRVEVLKVDVEGFEMSVFQGARKLLAAKAAPLIVFEFCDWAEARVPCARVGDAQRLLFEQGYSIWRLSDYSRRRKPLREPLTSGYHMLVASRN